VEATATTTDTGLAHYRFVLNEAAIAAA